MVKTKIQLEAENNTLEAENNTLLRQLIKLKEHLEDTNTELDYRLECLEKLQQEVNNLKEAIVKLK